MQVDEQWANEFGYTEKEKRPYHENDQNYAAILNYLNDVPGAQEAPDAAKQLTAQFIHKRGWKEWDRWYSRKNGVEPLLSGKEKGQHKRKNDEAQEKSSGEKELNQQGVFFK